MSNQPEVASYDAGVYQLEVTDAVDGGVGAKSNAPLLSLANRTKWLKQHIDNLENGITVPAGVAVLASPSFTGNPAAPNQAPGDNSTKLATTAFVQSAVNGNVTVSIAGGTTTTLTQAQYGIPVIILTGLITANKAVVLPNISGRWQFINNATGAFTVTLKTAAGNGVVITAGMSTNVFCDGTDVTLQQTDFISPAMTGNPTAPTQAVGNNSTRLATTAFVQAGIVAHTGVDNPHTQYLLRKDFAKDAGPLAWLGIAGGTSNALVLTPVSSETVLPAYAAGQSYKFIAATTCLAGGVTANVAGKGAVTVKKGSDAGLVDLDAADIKAGSQYDLNYDGTYFQLGGGVGSGKTFERYSFTAAVAQSDFTAAHVPGSVIVLRNGREVYDFTSAPDGSKITLAIPCNMDDRIEVLAFKSFKVADTYTKAELNALLATAGALPVGTMLPFPRGIVPPGFLEIDGSNFNAAVYPDLAAYLGGNTLPESRGEFLRGWDHGRGVDVGRAIGSYQGDAIRNITGAVSSVYRAGSLVATGAMKMTVYGSSPAKIGVVGADPGDNSTISFDASLSVPTADENRPRNLAVMWCIKAWNAPINQGTIDIAALAADVQKLKTMAVVGSYRRLSIVTTGLDGNVPVTAEQVTVGSAEYAKTLNNVGFTINSLSVGANGLDSGAMAASTWYSVWVIWNGATAAIAGLLSLSGTAPLLPAGFTHKALVGWVFTDATANKYPLSQIKKDKRVIWKVAAGSNGAAPRLMASGAATNTAVSTTAFVSPTANSIELELVQVTASAACVAPNASYGGVSDTVNPPPICSVFLGGSGGAHGKNRGDLLLESANIYWTSSGEKLFCLGYGDSV